jgi:hypothetical protein
VRTAVVEAARPVAAVAPSPSPSLTQSSGTSASTLILVAAIALSGVLLTALVQWLIGRSTSEAARQSARAAVRAAAAQEEANRRQAEAQSELLAFQREEVDRQVKQRLDESRSAAIAALIKSLLTPPSFPSDHALIRALDDYGVALQRWKEVTYHGIPDAWNVTRVPEMLALLTVGHDLDSAIWSVSVLVSRLLENRSTEELETLTVGSLRLTSPRDMDNLEAALARLNKIIVRNMQVLRENI